MGAFWPIGNNLLSTESNKKTGLKYRTVYVLLQVYTFEKMVFQKLVYIFSDTFYVQFHLQSFEAAADIQQVLSLLEQSNLLEIHRPCI